MIYQITIKEMRKAVVAVEADTRDEAREKLEKDYWERVLEFNDILEPYDTFFE